jgi:hypothetical protein
MWLYALLLGGFREGIFVPETLFFVNVVCGVRLDGFDRLDR